MSFFEGLGKVLGGLAGQAQELQEQINLYRPEYEGMSNSELREEGRRLSNRSDKQSRARRMAITQILKERGAM